MLIHKSLCASLGYNKLIKQVINTVHSFVDNLYTQVLATVHKIIHK